jgi:hypothetical protein
MSKPKKTVRINEKDLVDLIDNIVTEAVALKKEQWLAEQAKKGDKSAIFETRINQLEAKLNKLTEGKK